MTVRSKLWVAAAWLFTVINVVGAGMALLAREGAHAATHVGLLAAAYGAWRIVRARRQDEPAGPQVGDPRLDNLQQSLDAIAVEIERIGEAQRFDAKLQAERASRAGSRI